VQPRRSEIHPEERFACPDPFEAAFDLDNGRLLLTTLGETVFEVLPPTNEQRLGLRLHRGRVVVQRGPASANEPLTSVVVAVGEQHWSLELLEPSATIGVEVRFRRPFRFEPPADGVWYTAATFVQRGSLRFAGQDPNLPPLPAGAMHWLAAPAADEQSPADGLSATWIDPQQRQTSATVRRYATLFEKEFDAATAIDLSIPALVRDKQPRMAELAVRSLALTESYPALVNALARSDHAEARSAAATGLRDWLIQSANRQPLLRQELSGHFSGDDAVPAFRLLVGITPQEAQDRLVSLQVVDWLRSNSPAVRELAIGQLERLANRRYDYRPLGTPSQREPAIQRWVSHIDREGAIVKPE
jgi:hypothetical protein